MSRTRSVATPDTEALADEDGDMVDMPSVVNHGLGCDAGGLVDAGCSKYVLGFSEFGPLWFHRLGGPAWVRLRHSRVSSVAGALEIEVGLESATEWWSNCGISSVATLAVPTVQFARNLLLS